MISHDLGNLYSSILTEQSILKESVTYTVPGNPMMLLADFYAITYIHSFVDQIERGKINNPRNAMSYKVTDDIEYALSASVTYLKSRLLRDLFIAMSCEMQHFTYNDSDLKKYAPDRYKYIKQSTDMYNKYIGIYDSNDDASTEISRKYESIPHKIQERLVSFYYFAFLFSEISIWDEYYGGTSWGNIAKAWMDLLSEEKQNKQIVLIDHILDLQHNTGSVFSKTDAWSIDGEQGWLKGFLDYKYELTNIKDLIAMCSSQMAKLVNRALFVLGNDSKETEKSFIISDRNIFYVTNGKMTSIVHDPAIFRDFLRSKYVYNNRPEDDGEGQGVCEILMSLISNHPANDIQLMQILIDEISRMKPIGGCDLSGVISHFIYYNPVDVIVAVMKLNDSKITLALSNEVKVIFGGAGGTHQKISEILNRLVVSYQKSPNDQTVYVDKLLHSMRLSGAISQQQFNTFYCLADNNCRLTDDEAKSQR